MCGRAQRAAALISRVTMRRGALVLLLLLFSACREADGPAEAGANSPRFLLTSSPNGAAITIDNRSTGRMTPDTIALRVGDRRIELRLDAADFIYTYSAILRVERSDDVPEIELPLALQCGSGTTACSTAARRYHNAGGIRFAASGTGSMFFATGTGQGLFYPAGTTNSYVSSGMPVLAGVASTGDRTVANGVFDHHALAGRPAPDVVRAGVDFGLAQTAWVAPPLNAALTSNTVRAIEVQQQVIARDDVDGVLLVRVVFRNISDTPLIRAYAPHMPAGAVTYSNTWIGYAIDADIGSAGDDWVSYDPDMRMVFTYDANFSETGFVGEAATAPGLVGLRVLRAPAGTSVLLNSWRSCPPSQSCTNAGDWIVGSLDEAKGYGMLSGSSVYAPAHADPRVGHLPPDPADMRMSVSAGPLTLAPGGSAEIVIALAIAPPRSGTFTSGSQAAPGDPLDTGRALYQVAENMRARMIAAEGLLPPP
jgi:hypothetical protein